MRRVTPWILLVALLAVVLTALGSSRDSVNTGPTNARPLEFDNGASTEAARTSSRDGANPTELDGSRPRNPSRTEAGTASHLSMLTGVILASDGTPLHRLAFVSVRTLRFAATPLEAMSDPVKTVQSDPKTGAFRLDGLDAGAYRIEVDTVGDTARLGPFLGEALWVPAASPSLVEIRTPFLNRKENWCMELWVSAPSIPPGADFARVRLASGEERGPIVTQTDKSYVMAFDNLPEGPCHAHIEHPLYKTWKLDGANRHMGPVKVNLLFAAPTSPLRVRVRDARTMVPVNNANVYVAILGHDASLAFESVVFESVGAPRADFVEIPNIPCIAVDCTISAPGYATHEVTLPDPGLSTEPRTLDVKLSPLPSISGRLVGPDGRTPEHGVYIYAWKPKSLHDDNTEGAYTSYTRSGLDGSFTLYVKDAGIHAVVADWGCGVVAGSERFEHDGVQLLTGLVVQKPRSLVLRGQVIASPGTDFRGLVVFARSAGDPWLAVRHAPIRDDGSFTLDPLIAGPVDLFVHLRSREGGAILSEPSMDLTLLRDWGLAVPLGRVNLEGGPADTALDTILQFPVGAKLDTFVEAMVSIHGRPAPRHFVRARVNTGDGVPSILWTGAVTDATGRVRIGPIPPWPLTLEVLPAEQNWTWTSKSPIDAREGDANWISLDVDLREEPLELLDGAGELRPLTGITITSSLGQLAAHAVSDARGRVKLAYPPCSLWIQRMGSETSPVKLEWDGAAGSRVILP